MNWRERAGRVLKNSSLLPLYQAFGGLSEFWAIVFGTCGIILAFRGKLDSNFSAIVVAVQGILCAHDALDDYHSRKKRDGDKDEDSSRTEGPQGHGS